MNSSEDGSLENKNLSKAIERAQRGVEGKNFEIRKNVLQYDDVINQQRKVVYAERDKVLNNEDVSEEIQNMVKEVIKFAADKYFRKKKDYIGYLNCLYTAFMPIDTLLIPNIDKMNVDELIEYTYDISTRVYDMKKIMLGFDEVKAQEKKVLLEVVDTYWIDHIDSMDQLRQGIGLRALGQKDPVKEYTVEAFDMYEEFNQRIRIATLQYLYKFN